MLVCWKCDGRGWVPNGDIDDGMMTGRQRCPECDSKGHLTAAQITEHIHYVLSRALVPVGATPTRRGGA